MLGETYLYLLCRDIREPKQVKLVYDVLKFDPPEIEKAVLFATNNALVCETPEDAMKVAYEIDRSRYDVSLILPRFEWSSESVLQCLYSISHCRPWHWTVLPIKSLVLSPVVVTI